MAKFGPKPRSIEERFWPKVKKTDGCWLWLAKVNNNGYGMIGKTCSTEFVLAHRVSWEIANGPVPDGLCVLHRCDNPQCVNPNHLFLGTHAENMHDMHKKKRNKFVAHHGTDNGFAKLNFDKVKLIRQLHKHGATRKDLAEQFDVSLGTIRNVVIGRYWKEESAAGA